MAATSTAQIAQALLDAAAGALGAGVPARTLVAHGRPAWEACENDQLAVYWSQRTYQQSRTGKAGPSQAQVRPVTQFQVELVRCVPGLKQGGKAPTAAELTTSAKALMDDFDAIQRALLGAQALIFGPFPSVTWGTALPLGPSGYVAGYTWPIQAGT